MTLFTYKSRLTDIGLEVLAGQRPRLTIEPVEEAFGPNGLVSRVPILVPAGGSTGYFEVKLFPSGELTSALTGRTGIDYLIKVGRFEDGIDGESVFHGVDVWRFTAVAGGGNIHDMAGGSLLAVWVGNGDSGWPSPPLPKGLYIDRQAPNPYGIVT